MFNGSSGVRSFKIILEKSREGSKEKQINSIEVVGT